MHNIGDTVRIVTDENDISYTLERIEEKGAKTKLAHLEDEFGNKEIVALSKLAAPRKKAAPRKRKFTLDPNQEAIMNSPENHPAQNVAFEMGLRTNAFQASVDAEERRSRSAHETAAFRHALLLTLYKVPQSILVPKPGILNRLLGRQELRPNPAYTAINAAVEYHLSEAEAAK